MRIPLSKCMYIGDAEGLTVSSLKTITKEYSENCVHKVIRDDVRWRNDGLGFIQPTITMVNLMESSDSDE